MITSKAIYRWCRNKRTKHAIGVLYNKVDGVEVWFENGYQVPIREAFIVSDIKSAGYWLGTENNIKEEAPSKQELERDYTNVI
jgi:hypothetical protein